MERAKLQAVRPVLPSKDVQASIDFYVTRLGFTLAFQDSVTEPRYAGLRRDAIEIHVQWHDRVEWQPGLDRPMVRFLVSDVPALFEEYRVQSVFHEMTAVRDTAWGTREFAFYDIDWNGLTFYCDLPSV